MKLPEIAETFAAAQIAARAQWAKIEIGRCPRCTPNDAAAEFTLCAYRERDGCRIAPALEAQRAKDAKKAKLRSAGVPPKFWEALLDQNGLRPLQAVNFVRAFLSAGGWLLVLAGGLGCGKSIAASSAVAAMDGRFHSVDELANPTFAAKDGAWERKITAMKSASLLVLDELGDQHSPSGYAMNLVREILRHRDHEQLPTILTTNLPMASRRAGDADVAGLATLLTERIVSRLYDAENVRRGGGYRASTDPDQRRRLP